MKTRSDEATGPNVVEAQRMQAARNEPLPSQKCFMDTLPSCVTAVNMDRSSEDSVGNKDGKNDSLSRETQCREEAEMRGFKAFLITIKAFDVIVMVTVTLIVYLIESVALYPFSVFSVIEVMAFAVAIVHTRRPSLGVVLIYVSLEIGKALAAMTMAIVTVLYDRDKDCAVSECSTFNFSPVERFRFFWFLTSKAALGMFLCLVAMAHSPQLRDYNAEDDTVPLNF
nr:hypothetical protein HCOI_00917700 [Haemonchus contortus]